MGVLWDLAERAGVTCFGTSASYVAACMKDGVEPAGGPRPLAAAARSAPPARRSRPEGFDWVYEHIGADTWLFSTSGGTDVCTAFVGGVPLLPVYRGELQGRALGCKVEAFDEDGEPLVGEVGELVITEPMPSMPLYFWNDPDGERYRDSYFDIYPGIWRHGDWIEITERGTAIIYGRSDSTINRQGVRMGTSEIYRAVQAVPEVLDALVVDVPRPGTEGWMPLFVVLRDGEELERRADRRDQAPDPRAVLAAPRPERGLRDRRGPAHALGQGARGAGEADPDGHPARAGGEPRLAREPGRARLLRRAGRRARRGLSHSTTQQRAYGSVKDARRRHAAVGRRRHRALPSGGEWVEGRAVELALHDRHRRGVVLDVVRVGLAERLVVDEQPSAPVAASPAEEPVDERRRVVVPWRPLADQERLAAEVPVEAVQALEVGELRVDVGADPVDVAAPGPVRAGAGWRRCSASRASAAPTASRPAAGAAAVGRRAARNRRRSSPA